MSAPSDPLFATFVTMLIKTLTAMVPGSDDDTNETRRGIARLMFEAYEPRDAIEAMAAARAVAAHHAAMDNFNRAAQPGVSDATVVRLRSSAVPFRDHKRELRHPFGPAPRSSQPSTERRRASPPYGRS